MKYRDVYVYIPMILGYVTSYICPISENSSSNQKHRPPGWVFATVWPVLYFIIGYTWAQYSSNAEYNLFILLNLFLCSWIATWSCIQDKKSALLILAGSIGVTFALIIVGEHGVNLSPLIVWLMYAYYLNLRDLDHI